MKIKLNDFLLALIGIILFLHIAFEQRSNTIHDLQLVKVMLEKDSLNRVIQRKDSLVQMQIDTAYAVLEDLATQKTASTQQIHTWKQRIEAIKTQRSIYLNEQNK